MRNYESELAREILAIFKEKISPTNFDVIPIIDEVTYDNLKTSLAVDNRATKTPEYGRKEVFLGIDQDNQNGRFQMIGIIDKSRPVAIFTLGVEPVELIKRHRYVRSIDTKKQYTFEEIYGRTPDYLIIPAYTEALPEYRHKLAISGYRAMVESINLLAKEFGNNIVELVAQGNGTDIGKARSESINTIRAAKMLGLEQMRDVGALPSFGPVFFSSSI